MSKYLDYAGAPRKGWPIATGIIGAARYLVADRLDVTGARWGLEGAAVNTGCLEAPLNSLEL